MFWFFFLWLLDEGVDIYFSFYITHFFSFVFGGSLFFSWRVDWCFVFVREGFVVGSDATECLHCARCEMCALGNISDITEPPTPPPAALLIMQYHGSLLLTNTKQSNSTSVEKLTPPSGVNFLNKLFLRRNSLVTHLRSMLWATWLHVPISMKWNIVGYLDVSHYWEM